jgi:hypothetical protein
MLNRTYHPLNTPTFVPRMIAIHCFLELERELLGCMKAESNTMTGGAAAMTGVGAVTMAGGTGADATGAACAGAAAAGMACTGAVLTAVSSSESVTSRSSGISSEADAIVTNRDIISR